MSSGDPKANHRIVLVEDDAGDELMTLRALRVSGLALGIEVVRDGFEAIEALLGNPLTEGADLPPRLVLLDLKLPKLDGYEVLQAIRADPRMDCVPVVCLTSSGEPSTAVKAYRLGANSCVRKPIDYNDYISTVIRMLAYWLEVNIWPG